MNTNYLCETRLRRENETLHQLFCNSVFCLQRMLNKYQNIFPTYTDHTALHSLEVIDFCNSLIGEQIDKMNADEIYVLLMSAYLHDSGMGITEADYEEFFQRIDFGSYFEHHSRETTADIVRDFHHEFSGEYIKKYADFFEIPTPEHVFSIVQVSRGHRKTNLYDEKEYPVNYALGDGNTVCLPYLAALIRLADEMDIAADRNLQFMYDLSLIDNEFSRMEFRKHQAIRRLTIQEEAFILEVDTEEEAVWAEILKLKEKLNQTLTECRTVTAKRTPFTISQKEVLIQKMRGDLP